MNPQINDKLTIAVGVSAQSRQWKTKQLTWPQLVDRLSQSKQSEKTLQEFLKLSKQDQHHIKDVGGYVGGYLRDGKRSPKNVQYRQLLTLDIDFASTDFFEDFCMLFPNAAFLHATHKHSPSEPRYRLIMPLDRECTPDEYGAVSRYVAGVIGIDQFDNTTFEVNRLMFWPSHPKDVGYYCEEQEGEFLSVDAALATYPDWTDTSLWPTADKRIKELGDLAKKQQDPTMKPGTIGAFCRAYSIQDAISEFLSDVYEEGTDGRYTFTGGSTGSGLVTYDDMFAYSHHGTDPISGKLCNAFDLVRIHKFGHLDTGDNTKKSMQEMERFCQTDTGVKKLIAEERIAEAARMFDNEEAEPMTAEDVDWMQQLKMDKAMVNYLSSAENLNTIFRNDKHLAKAIRTNKFDWKHYISGKLPWRTTEGSEPIRNVDHSGIRNYVEYSYGIVGAQKIEDAFTVEAEKNSFHPVREYLTGLEWDGISRVETLLIDYFGADDNPYTREAIRKQLVASVARIFNPGCKYDQVLILVGKQGSGKSTFLKHLGGSYFSDTFVTFEGTRAMEQLHGNWIIEMPELSALTKADANSAKMFVSKQEDTFRPAYGHTTERYPRQNTFWGTSNDREILKDPSGDRRYWPIDLQEDRAIKSPFSELLSERDQIWAEAVALFRTGEVLTLSDQAAAIAFQEQKNHRVADDRIGLIEQYLQKLLPTDWDSKSTQERRNFLDSELGEGTEQRQYVCTAEIWCECFGRNQADMSRYNTTEINGILRNIDGWEPVSSTKIFKNYGPQRYYRRREGK